MTEDIDYVVRRTDGSVFAVRGMQVGRMALRMATTRETVVYPDGNRRERPFVIDHVPSGLPLGDFDQFSDALAYADDISRFTDAEDADAVEADELVAQLGPCIVAWGCECICANRHYPYRQWLAERKAA